MSKKQDNQNCNKSTCDCSNNHNHQSCNCTNDQNHQCECNSENKAQNNCGCQNNSDDEVIVSLCDDADSEAVIQKKRADEMVYQAQRIQAEFDNYRRRTAELNKQIKEDGRIEVIEKLLPALDAFSQAAKVVSDQNVLQGINLIYDRIMSTLLQFGLSKTEALGKEFDPNLHEAVMVRQDNAPAGTIVEVLQDGYTLNGKTIRAAMVITAS